MSSELEGFRLSAQQRRVWSLWGGQASARATCALLVEGLGDLDGLRRAAEDLARTHEILRTTFPSTPGLRFPFQVVANGSEISWRIEDLPAAVRHDPVAAAAELASREAAEPSRAERGPVFSLRAGLLDPSRHVVLLSLPALCADRRTLHLLARRLAEAACGRPRDATVETPIQYADFAQWQEDLLQASPQSRQPAFPISPKPIPFAGLGGEVRSNEAGFVLDPVAITRIDALCRARGCTAEDFLLACLLTLLWRTTEETDPLVARIDPGRGLPDLEEAIGLFASAAPLGVAFQEGESFFEILTRVSEARTRLEQSEDRPLQAGALESDRQGPRPTPGFEFWKRPDLPTSGPVSFSILQESSAVDEFPFAVRCCREKDTLRVTCREDGSRETSGVAHRLAEHLEPLVLAAAESPETRARDLPLLAPSERRRLLVQWNATEADFPRSLCIHELFEEQVERSPDSDALIFEEERLSYRKLNARANALAVRLRAKGVGPDSAVGLAIDRSADMVVALLGILKAGGAYVPLNPEHPPSRLARQLEQSMCALVVTKSRWLQRLAGFGGEAISIDSEDSPLDGRGLANPPRSADPSNLVYVMHTSGSTGVPKGVAVRHESLVNYAHFIARTLLGIDPQKSSAVSFATVSTIAADLGNTAIFPSLISGGTLHVIPYETAMEGGRFADYLRRRPIDVLKIVPSHFAALFASGGPGVLPRRALILGGEALPWDLAERVSEASPGLQIVNHYGPTEATVGSLVYRLSSGEKRGAARTVPIGRPIANTRVFILDPAGAPVPVGVPGELSIGGVGLARGYVGQPEETSKKFVASNIPGESGDLLYRTGDRARYLPHGDVEFLGRTDDQVKIRGFRVEPGEVAAVLSTHRGVAGAAVVAREDPTGGSGLVAYVVHATGSAPAPEDLKKWIREQLPEYMVPSALVSLKSLPLTANGKLDRRALPAPEETASERRWIAPRTASEETICRVWAELLRVERVGVDNNFFDLGGHSLLLTQVVSRLRKLFRRELPIRWLFESPTVESLAARIDSAEQEELARILDDLEGLPDDQPENPDTKNGSNLLA